MHPDLRNTDGFLVPLLYIWLCCLLLAGCERRETAPRAEQTAPAVTYAGTILAAGDSLTAGLGVAQEDAWPALLAKKLAENGHQWRVINAGIVQKAIGIQVPLFTAIFALARTVGWIAQLNEMIADPEYKIGRPRQLFVGAKARDVVPIAQR